MGQISARFDGRTRIRAVGALVVSILVLALHPQVADSAPNRVSCFEVTTRLNGSKHVSRSELPTSDRGFGSLDTQFGYRVRLKGNEVDDAAHAGYSIFNPTRFAIGGDGTILGGGSTRATSGGNPPEQALGSRTTYRLYSTESSFSYSMGLPPSFSVTWDPEEKIKKISNTAWTNTGWVKESGTLVWGAPINGRIDDSVHRISIASSVLTGGNGPAWTVDPPATYAPLDFWRSAFHGGEGTPTYSGLKRVSCGSVEWLAGARSGEEKPDEPVNDTTAPTLAKPVAHLESPTSRVANYSIEATDDTGVTKMRVKATGDPDWRPWVDYVPQGTVILPDRYGEFTIWFQVRDAAGNLSSQRAADNVTRVQDTTAPTLGKPLVTHSDPTSRTVSFSLDAGDDMGTVSQMRVRVGPDEAEFRPWVDFVPSGTVILPDRYGTFTIWFQVMDPSGNVSFERAADNVTRTAAVGLTLQQIDNNGNVRSCGATETQPCSDVVRKFRNTISSPVLPDVDLLVKAWRLVNGSWIETDPSPHMRMAISGHVMEFEFTANALAGVWRFQTQVPRDPEGVTDFGASNYQYLRID